MEGVMQKRLELISQEFEELHKINLYSLEEIGVMQKKIRDFENKIYAVTASSQVYEDYILYQQQILKEITARRNERQITEKKVLIEFKIVKRIKALYDIALNKFPKNINLFRTYLKFCKKGNFSSIEDMLTLIIEKNCENEEVYKIVAEWYFYERKDKNSAMNILSKGTSKLTYNKILYRIMIELELHSLQNINKTSCVYDYNKLSNIITITFNFVTDSSFYIELLEILRLHKGSESVQSLIADHLINKYSDEEIIWHTLAQKEYKDWDSTSNEDNALAYITRLKKCLNIYKEGLLKISEENKSKLRILYLDFLIKLLNANYCTPSVLKRETFFQALTEAYSENCLLERHYVSWLNFANDANNLNIAEKGTQAFPDSVELWKARLRLVIAMQQMDSIQKVFELGIHALKERALPLWIMLLNFHYLTSSDDFIESIYQQGIKEAEEISKTLKPQYLQWLLLTKGISEVRKIYRLIATEKPYCKQLHDKMSKFESLEIEPNYLIWEEVHVLATSQFGNEDVDVWIDYIQFYLNYKQNPHISIQSIQEKAISVLPQIMVFEFVDKYKKIIETRNSS